MGKEEDRGLPVLIFPSNPSASTATAPPQRQRGRCCEDAGENSLLKESFRLQPDHRVTLSRRMQCPFLRQHIYFLLKQHEKHRLNKERFPLRVHRHSSRTECYFCSLSQLSYGANIYADTWPWTHYSLSHTQFSRNICCKLINIITK